MPKIVARPMCGPAGTTENRKRPMCGPRPGGSVWNQMIKNDVRKSNLAKARKVKEANQKLKDEEKNA